MNKIHYKVLNIVQNMDHKESHYSICMGLCKTELPLLCTGANTNAMSGLTHSALLFIYNWCYLIDTKVSASCASFSLQPLIFSHENGLVGRFNRR